MSKQKQYGGQTSVTLPIFVQATNSTTGGGLAGLTHATSGLVCEYRRQGQSAWTAITLVSATLGTWTSGGFTADGALNGAYELDLPDAVCASGARWVAVRLRGASNMLPCLIEIELDAVNYQDAVGFGLSRLDAAISSRLATSGYTAPPSAATIATAVWGATIEGSRTAAGLMRVILSAVANKLSGANTTTVRTRDDADTKDRLVVTVDSFGNRTAVTKDDA